MSRIEDAIEKAIKMREGERVRTKTRTPWLPRFKVPKVPRRAKIDNPSLVTILDPRSSTAEEYRKLKSMVVKKTKADGFQNVLMVTSAIGGEGKSVTALNLSIALAQEYDHTVLLVDADLRKPSLNDYLGIHARLGLSDCLANGVSIGNTLIKTGIGGLVFLPSGGKVSNPGELLSSVRMMEIVKELKCRYPDRYVVFDAPPVLPFAEVLSLGSIVDGVIFVVREGFTPTDTLKEAVDMMADANILGIVYNAADIPFFGGHGYYSKSDYYGEDRR